MKTPHELACAISALINSSPRSPTIAELEEIIRTHCPPVTVGPASEELKGLIPARKQATVSLTNKELAQEVLKALRDAQAEDARPAGVWIAKHFPDQACEE